MPIKLAPCYQCGGDSTKCNCGEKIKKEQDLILGRKIETQKHITFNQGEIEIQINFVFGVFENASLWYRGKSRSVSFTEDELLFIYESLGDYFNKIKKENEKV